jgi:uncharacterized protein YdeI (YjbR/CyaY-like superfamily)
MGKKDPRVDAYITKSADFARPILEHIRDAVHATCPEVKETIKWGMPFFMYKGMLCSMAAFKSHCTLGFIHESLRSGLPDSPGASEAMGTFGKLTALGDLPSEVKIANYIRKAIKLNEAGMKAMGGRQKKEKRDLTVPHDLAASLRENKKALATFEAFSYSKKRDYIDWLDEAKSEDTRKKRLVTAIEWISAGKERNWKYTQTRL